MWQIEWYAIRVALLPDKQNAFVGFGLVFDRFLGQLSCSLLQFLHIVTTLSLIQYINKVIIISYFKMYMHLSNPCFQIYNVPFILF